MDTELKFNTRNISTYVYGHLIESNKWSNGPETISDGLKLWMVYVCVYVCTHVEGQSDVFGSI